MRNRLLDNGLRDRHVGGMVENPSREPNNIGPVSPTPEGRTVDVLRTYLSLSSPSALRRSAPPALDAQLREIPDCSIS